MSVHEVKGLPGSRFQTVKIGSADKAALIQCVVGQDPVGCGMGEFFYWEFERCAEVQELLTAVRSRDDDADEMPREILVDWLQFTSCVRTLNKQRKDYLIAAGAYDRNHGRRQAVA